MRAFFLRAMFVGCLLAPLGALRLAAQVNPDLAKVQNPVAASPESLAAGKETFRRSCANCHGLNAEGSPGNDLTPPAPDLTDKEWKHGSSDGEIFNVIKNGIPPNFEMGAWGDQLKDEEIWNAVNYIRSLAKK